MGEEDSGALPRFTGPAKDIVKGSINKRPFRPGGLDASQSLSKVVPGGALNGEWIHKVLDGGSAETTPPSFKQGLDLGELNVSATLFCNLDTIIRKLFLNHISALPTCGTYLTQSFFKVYPCSWNISKDQGPVQGIVDRKQVSS